LPEQTIMICLIDFTRRATGVSWVVAINLLGYVLVDELH
jgi:hypothetical protein